MNLTNPPDYRHDTVLPLPLDVKACSWAVDAACSGNPGQMEYQGIDLATGEQVFHFGPDKIIYSDSFTAMTWVHKKHCKTKLERNPKTEKVLDLVRRAEQWLRVHPVRVPIIQWETKLWGEIPADFGRKNNYLKGR